MLPLGNQAAPLRVRRSSPPLAIRSRPASVYYMLVPAMLIWAILIESAFLLALAGAGLGLIHWKDRKKRLPFTQKILRPPGESLRLRLTELDEKLNDCFVQLFLSAYSPLVVAGLVALQGVRPSTGVWITVAAIAAIASIWSAYR